MARTLTEPRPAGRALLLSLVVAAAVLGLPGVAPAATVNVAIRDNAFLPQELHVEPGDTVVWTNGGRRVHDVTSDTGEFLSGDLNRGASFSFTFEKEGYYYYHCSFHGRAGRRGMWGVVVVGDPPPPHHGGGEKPGRPKIAVPGDFATIQGAVDSAEPGSTIVIGPGEYAGGVSVTTDDLILRGSDRYRTVLNGEDERAYGFVVDGARKVSIANLTVRNFTGAGILFTDARRYTAARVDAIKNRTYGIRAERSYDGLIEESFGWGSGHSAFSIAECMGCSALVDDVYGAASYLGFSGVNVTGVTVRRSTWTGNGAGIASLSGAGESAPGRGTLIVGNLVRYSADSEVPPPASTELPGIPMGTGVWTAGVRNDVVRANTVLDSTLYGVLVTDAAGDYVPGYVTVAGNRVRRAAAGTLAWDGTGSDNCFADNDVTGETEPGGIEALYPCSARPFEGAPYRPVQDAVAAAIAESLERTTREPPEPDRPPCQKGRPGCHRH